jgi:lysophospholipase L1-like esterase
LESARAIARVAGVTAALGLLAGCGGSAGSGGGGSPTAACGTPTWVGTWSADPSDAVDLGIVDQTSRTMLTANLGGERVRVRLSNRFGAAPVTFAAASVALREGAGAGLVPGSRRALTFGGAATVTVATGADVVSDPVGLKVSPSSDLAVSLFARGATGPATEHAVGQQTSFFTPPGSGDHTGDDGGGAFTLPTQARYFVSGVDVQKTEPVGAVVALGDSITDGFGGPPDGRDRYPDFLSRRLLAAGRRLASVNAGIGGNHVLSDGPAMDGPSALHRLAVDVIDEPGVSDVIVLEGVNDIAAQQSAAAVIAGLGQIVSRLHAAGLGVQLGTLLPFDGPAGSPAEQEREQINKWIRGPSTGADGVIDFDAAVRDPTDLLRLAPAADSGDHLHPSAAGRRAMAQAVDLGALRAASCRQG